MESLKKRMGIQKLLVFSEIKKICYHEAELCKCDGLVNDVRLDSQQPSIAGYNHRYQTICFNGDLLYSDAFKAANIFIDKCGLVNNNFIIYANFMILVTIFHEIEHVLKKKEYLAGKMTDLEEYLYVFCHKISKENKEFYNKNYKYLSTEIDAELTSWEKSIKLLLTLGLSDKEILCFEKIFIGKIVIPYEEKYSYRYKNNYIGPAEKMINRYSKLEYLRKKSELSKAKEYFSMYERIKMGLSLSKFEYKDLLKACDNTKIIDIDKIIIKK